VYYSGLHPETGEKLYRGGLNALLFFVQKYKYYTEKALWRTGLGVCTD